MNEIKVLDHGYVRLIESWGSDRAIIEAARMSTQKGFLGWSASCEACQGSGCVKDTVTDAYFDCPACDGTGNKPGDEKLLRFLWEKHHTTPFEFGGMIIEVAAPIFVFREWHRHRTQSFNEASARYAPLPDVNFAPTVDRCTRVSATNRQAGAAGGSGEVTEEVARLWLGRLLDTYAYAEETYQEGLAAGIPKEIARVVLPVGRYSKMRASANLLNWLRFERLRLGKDAQEEIREYAQAVHMILTGLFPRTLALFDEERASK
jgi:thymidylate synthase (FAD)